ncbi:hypothetical protein Pmar_PMAR023638 [Perkinsus marinus ATCC 50983]|uniref:Adenylate kinase n=1 Tax=Perkinsus marinus (strain ATCC 50983 / TXsc) TaxID=423536 RepID=C5KCW3_PERM5|nr:hypothetical protein Pmar_PMAR023638 [Perkinsus marinus ATCC 50983]EER17712.1 hypothetical protein Pmar_PMAR023638 [Perkinsus marinus ATCC 50983]|eukprot:XP_002785916.1 hypothetical protein Pmar_PMAR023638 [Perkinsus marinus ATCC 50983]
MPAATEHPVPVVFESETEEYFKHNQIYETVRQLLQDVLLQRPTDPLHFMADWLNHGGNKGRFILLAPPSIDLNSLCDSVIAMRKAEDDGAEVAHIKYSDVCRGITDPSRPDADSKIAEAMAAAVEAEEANHKAWIISGFPNTRAQARLMLTKWRIVPDRVLLLTLPEGYEHVKVATDEKIEGLYEERVPGLREVLRNISTEMEVDPCNEEDTAQRMYDLLFDRDGSSTTRKEA